MLLFFSWTNVYNKDVAHNGPKRFLKVEGKIMTKWTALLSGITITSLLLTGCGTANNNEVKENPSTSETQNNTAQTNTTENQDNPSSTEETNASEESNTTEKTNVQLKRQPQVKLQHPNKQVKR